MNARDPMLPVQPDESDAIARFADRAWDDEIVPMLTNYIAIPAKSPMFDADWAKNGHIEKVITDAAAWVEGRKVAGLKLDIVRLEGRTPVIFFEVPATRAGGNEPGAETVCLYGHLDKQPEFTGWRNDLGPWTPKYLGGLLYGRGGADDGYAVYAALTAIMALDAQGIPRPRCVGIIESCEESGSFDLPAYIDALTPRLGRVGLVVCLDSGAGNYDQLWLTTSLRGMVSGVLKVEVLTEGVHSGDSSGLVPSSFRVLRQVLDRLEDSRTGELLPQSFHCEIPADRLAQTRATARILGDEVWKRFPWACGADGVRRDGDGVQPRRTEAAHRRARHGQRQPRHHRHVAADVEALRALGKPGAHDHVLDLRRIELRNLLQRVLDARRRHVVGAREVEGATKRLGEPGARAGYHYRFTSGAHGVFLSC